MTTVLRATIIFLLMGIGMVRADAANLQISPVAITFRPGMSAANITLHNQGDQPIYGQVRAFAWRQQQGEDVLEDAQELVVSPPLIEIAAQASQVIRIVRRNPAPVAAEQTFRLLIDEISRDGGVANGVDIRLRYSVPVFVAPSAPAQPQLAWKLSRQGDSWLLGVANTGTQHAQLGATKLVAASGTELELSKGLLGYVLAGQERSWPVPVPAGGSLSGPLELRGTVNAKPFVVVPGQ